MGKNVKIISGGSFRHAGDQEYVCLSSDRRVFSHIPRIKPFCMY